MGSTRRALCNSLGLVRGLGQGGAWAGQHVAAAPGAAAAPAAASAAAAPWPFPQWQADAATSQQQQQQQQQQQHHHHQHLLRPLWLGPRVGSRGLPGRGLPWAPGGVRGLHSEGAGPSNVIATQALLDSLQASKLQENIAEASATRPCMTYREFLDFVKSRNGADCDAEAEALADTLTRAGVILRLNSVVYLRPQEIAEMVFRVIPTDPAEARRKLDETEAQLAELDEQHRLIQRAASRWPRFWLQAGCMALFLQLVGFAYLTWWELSWDVMEPVAYMLSLTYSFIAYIYFLSRGSVLDYGPFMKYWTEQQLRKKMNERGFDIDRYQALVRQSDRYRRYLAAQAAAEQAGKHV